MTLENRHISSLFENDLETIQAHIVKMGGLVEVAIIDATKSFDRKDIKLAKQVKKSDTAIDDLDFLINQEAARIIALRAPTAIDLRIILSVIKVSTNLERIGDLAKNIAKRTRILLKMSDIENSSNSLRRLVREVELMLKDALDAYVQRDSELAYNVIERDNDIDQMYNGLFREFITFMMEDPRNITACMHLHFMAKNIERMGDHVTSIAEQVIYMTTGDLPMESREKIDLTSVITNNVKN